MEIDDKLGRRLQYIGILPDGSNTRAKNEGTSNYNNGEHIVTPWVLWLDYSELTSFDHDILKRILRVKVDKGYTLTQQRALDYRKIIHICQERLRQLEYEEEEDLG